MNHVLGLPGGYDVYLGPRLKVDHVVGVVTMGGPGAGVVGFGFGDEKNASYSFRL